MNPYEAPEASFEKGIPSVRHALDWKAISFSGAVYLMSAVLGIVAMAAWASMQFGVLIILLGLYVLPQVIGAVCLACLTKHRWVTHGVIYSMVPVLSIMIFAAINIRGYIPGPADCAFWVGSMSTLTLLTMAVTRFLRGQPLRY